MYAKGKGNHKLKLILLQLSSVYHLNKNTICYFNTIRYSVQLNTVQCNSIIHQVLILQVQNAVRHSTL